MSKMADSGIPRQQANEREREFEQIFSEGGVFEASDDAGFYSAWMHRKLTEARAALTDRDATILHLEANLRATFKMAEAAEARVKILEARFIELAHNQPIDLDAALQPEGKQP